MGTGHTAKKPGARSKNKKFKRSLWLSRRDKDIDQVQDELTKAKETGKPIAFAYDDDLPGGGQFYCAETARHFADAKSLADHKKTKAYKRRLKNLKNEKYDQGTADWGAGMTKETLPPAHGNTKTDE